MKDSFNADKNVLCHVFMTRPAAGGRGRRPQSLACSQSTVMEGCRRKVPAVKRAPLPPQPSAPSHRKFSWLPRGTASTAHHGRSHPGPGRPGRGAAPVLREGRACPAGPTRKMSVSTRYNLSHQALVPSYAAVRNRPNH